MESRLDYRVIAPDGYKAFGRVHHYVGSCGLEPTLIDLVYLRVSQINGCAFCVDLHWRDLVKNGVSERKINGVAAWEESTFFSARERAAFAWAESLTLVAQTRAPDATYQAAKSVFNDKELVDLSYAVALMNAYNRLGVGFRRPPEGT